MERLNINKKITQKQVFEETVAIFSSYLILFNNNTIFISKITVNLLNNKMHVRIN